MTWLTWLVVVAVVVAIAAVTGFKPKGTRHVARTNMMGVARFVLLLIVIIVAYLVYRSR
jgi:choline-glycine betaine transporter